MSIIYMHYILVYIYKYKYKCKICQIVNLNVSLSMLDVGLHDILHKCCLTFIYGIIIGGRMIGFVVLFYII